MLELPEQAPDPLVSVIVLEYDSYPSTIDGLVAQSVYGGFSLTPGKAQESSGSTKVEAPSRGGTVPAHIVVSEKSSYSWQIFVDRPMSLHFDVSYSYQGEAGNGIVRVRSRSGSKKANFKSSGMFVGEPNRDWQIDSYNSHRLGQLEFSEPGYYDITLEIEPGKGEKMDFQWLWLGEK